MSEEPFQLGDYSQFGLAAAEAALFSAWEALEKFHGDLVVVGGLAVHYHTRDEKNSRFPAITHCIAASPLKPMVQNSFPEHALLRDGYLGMRGHLTRKFTEQDFRTMAACTALLAAHLRAGAVIDFESVRYAGTKEQIDALLAASFNNTLWDWADGLRQVNPEAYHYWLAASRLLGISGKK